MPSTSTRIRWRFGSKRRRVAAIEWLRLLPKPGLRAQMEETLDIRGRFARFRGTAQRHNRYVDALQYARDREPAQDGGDATAPIESDDRCAHRRRCARTR